MPRTRPRRPTYRRAGRRRVPGRGFARPSGLRLDVFQVAEVNSLVIVDPAQQPPAGLPPDGEPPGVGSPGSGIAVRPTPDRRTGPGRWSSSIWCPTFSSGGVASNGADRPGRVPRREGASPPPRSRRGRSRAHASGSPWATPRPAPSGVSLAYSPPRVPRPLPVTGPAAAASPAADRPRTASAPGPAAPRDARRPHGPGPSPQECPSALQHTPALVWACGERGKQGRRVPSAGADERRFPAPERDAPDAGGP